MYHFEWDENKNQRNQSKHGISFKKRKAVFMTHSRSLFMIHITAIMKIEKY